MTTLTTSAETYFIRPDYESRAQPCYFVDTDGEGGVDWQPEVYGRECPVTARALGATRIVDIGCGNGHKLVRLAGSFELIGVDFGENIATCRRNYPFAEWLEWDADSGEPLPLSSEQLAGSVIVCADVIEHLVHPERLLASLRDGLAKAEALLLSTPERERTRGAEHLGPCPNPHHVREWAIDELARLLEFSGFEHGTVTLTRTNTGEPVYNTILAKLFPDADRAAKIVADSP